MQNRLARVSVAILTCLTGMMVHRVWQASFGVVSQQRDGQVVTVNQLPLVVSVCDLQNAPAYFQGKLVRVEGILYGDFLLYGSCSDARSGPPVIGIWFQGLDSHLNGLWGRLNAFPAGVKMEVDVSVEGVVEYHQTNEGRINITISTDGVTELSPLRPFKLKGAA
jgi:hypothetical protein